MLLTARNIAKSYGPRLLFSGITLGLEEEDRIGLIGANGSGKSTMLRVFAGLEQLDEGIIETKQRLRTAYVAQADEFDPSQTCLQIVADSMDEHLDHHERETQAYIALDRAGFTDPSTPAGKLSGGWKKRLAIVRATASQPDLLLLDEPTNHLDIEGIEWLEGMIEASRFATLTISHDRRFLESIGNRIIELDKAYPDGYLGHRGSYTDFLEKREEFLSAQQGRQQALASTVRREIEWLRRGAKARTTKAKGRIDRAGEMMDDLADLRSRNAQRTAADIDFLASDRRTKKLVELKNVTKSMGGRKLFENLDLILSPGKKVGLLGQNGAGKSTLIRLITKELTPDEGTVFHADALKVVVFDQHREELDPQQTLRQALSPTGETVIFQGQAMHVSGWARKFLFRTEQLDLPLKLLSGGEQSRVLIARLMLKEADVLILDEPTNDLDIPTLEVLENSLDSFSGSVVLVTHDRYLLDRISTEILSMDGDGNTNIYITLSQWEQAKQQKKSKPVVTEKSKSQPKPTATSSSSKKKLNWNEQKELDNMETNIHSAEVELTKLQEQLSDPKILADHEKMRDVCEKVGVAQEKVSQLYERWAILEEKSKSL